MSFFLSTNTLKEPLFFPFKEIHLSSISCFESLSINLINSLASKFFVSFPFFISSSSSRTVIGIPISFSSKFIIES